jgi:helicase SWR1
VHIYRFISQYTVEEAMLRKANQKRSLDDLVIQKGEFDWQNFFRAEEGGPQSGALQRALVEFEDFEDANAAKVVANEEAVALGEEREEFDEGNSPVADVLGGAAAASGTQTPVDNVVEGDGQEEGGTVTDYMLRIVYSDLDFFRGREWRIS